MKLFTCDWIFNILVVLCDGKVVCGCADPYGQRPLGDLNTQTIMEIWQSEKVKEIRRGLNSGYSPFCLDCGLKKSVPEKEAPPQRPVDLENLPRIFFEPTVLCNLSCYHSVCSKDSGIIKTRNRFSFPFEDFQKLLDPIGSRLIRLDFFNYGESFCHPQAVDMVEYIKAKYPNIFLYTSTNGLMLDEEKSRRIVAAGLDEITFSVDGADATSYSRYRRGGDFGKLLEIMKCFVRLRNDTGFEVPFINWRYILFRWNDSARQMKKARRLAGRIGVDRLTWEITDHPEDAYSKKFSRGTEAWKKICYEIWDTSQIGSAIKGKRYLANIRIPVPEIRAARGQVQKVKARIKNIGGATWLFQTHSGRRWVRLGAQLYSRDRQLIELNFARAFLPRHIRGGDKEGVEIELPPAASPGSFWLKFDMVAEGMDWFENGGSRVLWKPFVIH